MTSDRSSPCLEHETLVALIAGQLRLDENPEVEEHLAECTNCQNIVAAAAAGLAGSQEGPASELEHFPKPGDVVAGKYRIEKVLGRGGMGTVFAARHDELGQTVALKVLHSAAPTAAARFAREAKISAQLLSEHTARVFDLGSSAGVPFLVMEYLAGEDLASVLTRGAVSPAVAVEYARQICAALTEAHAAGIVHRDLKPSNVFVVQRTDGSRCLKVLDFGISKRLIAGQAEKSHDLTNAHTVLGSPAYMSPEQLRQSHDVDSRTDLWSLGVLLYELLTRKRPFQAWSLAGLSAAIAADSPPPPSSVNPQVTGALDRVVMRCLKKEPGERFASAAEVAEALSNALLRPRPPAPRRWLIAATGLGLVTAAYLQFAPHGPDVRKTTKELRHDPPPDPVPTPTPSGLVVHCDTPYPLGDFVFRDESALGNATLERAWPIAATCSANAGDTLRTELAQAFAASSPVARASLHPPHPCYRVAVRSHAGEVTLELERLERCRIELTLVGASCEQIRRVDVSSATLPSVTVSHGASDSVSSSSQGPRCRRSIELPFEAYGKRLGVELKPADFTAAEAAFGGERLELAVHRRRPRPLPCVPPDYCRN